MMIDILLATYNSEPFLREQMDSLHCQSEQTWRLLVHDGGSTDATIALIESYAAKDRRIVYLGSSKMDAASNFAFLWKEAQSEYVMFCDHDDVWYPEKIAKELALMKQEEAAHPEAPIAVFSDAAVVDGQLRPLHPSSFAWQGLNPHHRELRQLLLQNVAAGNTMLVNRRLHTLCGSIPAEAVMHDHWLMLLAAACGRIALLNEPTLDYRQHGNNVYGASHFGAGYFMTRLRSGIGTVRRRFYQNVTQADAFLSQYRPMLSAKDCALLEAFASLPRVGWLKRRWILLRGRIRKSGMVRNLGTLLIV